MANSNTLMPIFLVYLFLTFHFSFLVTANFYRTISPTPLGSREEKLTHFKFYFHEIYTSQKPSVVIAAEPLKGKHNSPLPFGSITVLENPLTIEPDVDSKLIGKAQGFYLSATKREGIELELVMGFTITITEGEYDGSTICVFGRNVIVTDVREMPIIGGTGAFRFARGYVEARTAQVDYYVGDAIVEYNVYVTHYSSSSSSKEEFNEGIQFMEDPILGKTNTF